MLEEKIDYVASGNTIALREYLTTQNQTPLDVWVGLSDEEKTKEKIHELYPDALQKVADAMCQLDVQPSGPCRYCVRLLNKFNTAPKCPACTKSFVCEEHKNVHLGMAEALGTDVNPRVSANECKTPPIIQLVMAVPKDILQIFDNEVYNIGNELMSKISIETTESKLIIKPANADKLFKQYKAERKSDENLLTFVVTKCTGDDETVEKLKKIADASIESKTISGSDLMIMQILSSAAEHRDLVEEEQKKLCDANLASATSTTTIWKWIILCMFETMLS